MDEAIMKKLFSVSLKARILRTWQKANEGGQSLLTERDVLALEFIEEFSAYSPVMEGTISKIFGSPSSASDLVKKLTKAGLLTKLEDQKGLTRNKPLLMTDEGKQALEKVKLAGAARYSYLLSDFSSKSDWNDVMAFLTRVDVAATKAVRKHILGEYELDFEKS